MSEDEQLMLDAYERMVFDAQEAYDLGTVFSRSKSGMGLYYRQKASIMYAASRSIREELWQLQLATTSAIESTPTT
jgi:hypothetical protein